MIRPADQLTQEQSAQLSKLAQTREKVAAKIRGAYEDGRRAGVEASEGLLREAAIAQRADHDKQMAHAGKIMRHHLIAEIWGARWLGVLIGVLLGSLATTGVFWMGLDPLMSHGFEAASDATARGVAIGSVQREAEGGN